MTGAAVVAGVAGLLLHVERAKAKVLHEVRSLWGLSGVMNDGRAWPPPGGWALGADALAWLLLNLDPRQPLAIVELGPGTSSVVLGRSFGSASIWGLEHDEQFFRSVARTLAAHGLDGYRLIHAPLSAEDGRGPWYSLSALAELPARIDLLIVDGPPNPAGKGAREQAVPRLRDRLTDGGLILVDDTHRLDERRMVRAWMATDDGLVVEHDGDSFMVLRFTEGAASQTRDLER